MTDQRDESASVRLDSPNNGKELFKETTSIPLFKVITKMEKKSEDFAEDLSIERLEMMESKDLSVERLEMMESKDLSEPLRHNAFLLHKGSSGQNVSLEKTAPTSQNVSLGQSASLEKNALEGQNVSLDESMSEGQSVNQGQCGFPRSVKRKIVYTIYGVLICGYFVYFTLALVWNFNRAIPLLCLTLLVVIRYAWRHLTRTNVNERLQICLCRPVSTWVRDLLERRLIRILCYIFAVVAMVTYCVVVNINRPYNLVSLAGLVVLLVFSWTISYDRFNVSFRPVVWGLGTQLILGVLVRTDAGQDAFAWLGHQVEVFLDYVTAGVLFVFGEKYVDFYFAFKLMPTVIFVSSAISILYYLGIMQVVVNAIAMVMKVTMGTTAPETVTTAASIFLGQPEASLTIRPYLNGLSRSELHAIMTAGFASVSADIFALFVNYGVSSAHILTAVLMSAPAGLAISKIVYPQEKDDTKDLQPDSVHDAHEDLNAAQNVIDAAARGAQEAVPIVFAVCATLIAFLATLEFLNAVLRYLGSLVDIHDLTFDLILSYILMPLAFLMGVPWQDCRVVGEVIGLKTLLNELVGYQRLGEYIQQGALSSRSRVIAVYALCGFSNPSTVGVTLGGLGALMPGRRKDLSDLVISAWISGCVACFLTACFAGLLYEEGSFENSPTSSNVTIFV